MRDQEVVIETPDGLRRFILANVDPLLDEDGSLVGGVNCFQDITALKVAEASKAESERRFHDLLQALPAAIYTTDAAGRITFYNQAAVELWGCRPEIGSSRMVRLVAALLAGRHAAAARPMPDGRWR